MVNYKNSNEHYVANYILYGEIGGSEESPVVYLYHDSDLEYDVKAKEFKEMFFGAPVHVRIDTIPGMDGLHCESVVYTFVESDDDIGAFMSALGNEMQIVFPE